MAKKKQVEVIEEATGSGIGLTNPLFPLEDKNFMLSLWKTASPTDVQIDMMYDLYRKYINPNQPRTRGNCGGCSGNINNVYTNLRDWYSKNSHRFES